MGFWGLIRFIGESERERAREAKRNAEKGCVFGLLMIRIIVIYQDLYL